MIEYQQQNNFYLSNIEFAAEQLAQLFNIEYWQQQNRIAGLVHGRGITCFLNTEDLFGTNSVLRNYYRGGAWGRLNKDRYFFSELATTRSFSEFKLLNQLHELKLAVPKPVIACVKKLAFNYYKAAILIYRIENSQELAQCLQVEQLEAKTWMEIGKLIRQMHDLDVYHSDLNSHNILLQNQGEQLKCWLIDFDKCKFIRHSKSAWKADNLSRLHRSLLKEVDRMKIHFSEQQWQFLLAGYHT